MGGGHVLALGIAAVAFGAAWVNATAFIAERVREPGKGVGRPTRGPSLVAAGILFAAMVLKGLLNGAGGGVLTTIVLGSAFTALVCGCGLGWAAYALAAGQAARDPEARAAAPWLVPSAWSAGKNAAGLAVGLGLLVWGSSYADMGIPD